MNPEILDAEWAPTDSWESPTKITNPTQYIRKTIRRRRAQSRRVTVFCQRVLLGSLAFLAWAILLALLV